MRATFFPHAGFSQNIRLRSSVFDMGYVASASANNVVKSVIGQLFVGTTSQSDNVVEGGFLADTLLRGIMVSIGSEPPGFPKVYTLWQNYPNPFNPTTVIRFDLPERSIVTLKIYDILGQEILTLLNNSSTEAGQHSVVVDVANLPSGVYFYRLLRSNSHEVNTFQSVKKMLVVK